MIDRTLNGVYKVSRNSANRYARCDAGIESSAGHIVTASATGALIAGIKN